MSNPVRPNAAPGTPSGKPAGKPAGRPAKPSPKTPSKTPVKSQKTEVYRADFENLDVVREFVSECAHKCGLNASGTYAAQLAVDEAFSNIIEHAYGGESQEVIKCTCLITADSLVIQLCDYGKPFDPASIPDPDLDVELEERDVGGLGLYFIRQLMDEVEFTFFREEDTGRRCNVLRMVKRKEK
jgi:anti-sigma regulatory factor (Ser/Thr protein kinase)